MRGQSLLVAGALLWSAPFTLSAQDTTGSAQAEAVEDVSPDPQAAATKLEPKPQIIPTGAFSNVSKLSSAKLSPSGATVAVRVELEGQPYILLFEAGTRKATGKLNVGDKVELGWFRWVTDSKILFSVSTLGNYFGDEARYTRLYLADIARRSYQFVGRDTSTLEGDDVIHVADDGSHILLSMQRTPYDYPSVWRIELKEDGVVEEVQRPRDGIWNWHADEKGVVRMGMGWLRKRLRVYYRKDATSDLKLIGRLKEDEIEERVWDVAQIVSGSDQGYILEEGENGRVGIRLFDYAKREVIETFYENSEWDVDSMALDDGKPIAAFYTDDRDQVEWFDDGLKQTYTQLKQALGAEEIWITSRAKDNSRMLVWAGNEADPGAMYVFTPGEKRLDQFAELRPSVDYRLLAKPKPVSYEARDGTRISAYLTLPRGRVGKNLPLILLPHGGPYGVRDKLRYDDDVQLLANRGYAVLQPNFRGSAGYGEAFSKLGVGQIGRGMQDDIDDAMDWAVEQGIADRDRVCVVGGSYGGYAALWAVIRNPERYRCAASWAGVTDWDLMLKYDRRYFTRKGGKRWRATVEGDEDFDLDTVSPYRLGETLNRPVLLAHGKDDNNVPYSQFRKMRNATKRAPVKPDLLLIEDEGHSFSEPENQKIWYDALVAFLAKHNPSDTNLPQNTSD